MTKSKTFSDELRDAIATAGISRNQISLQTGIDPATLSRFVHGKGGLSTEALDKIAAALGLHVAIGQRKHKPKGK